MAKQLLKAAPGSQPKIRHGTQSGYRTHKCKCPECRAWKSADMALYRERRRQRDPNWREPSGWHRYNRKRNGAYE